MVQAHIMPKITQTPSKTKRKVWAMSHNVGVEISDIQYFHFPTTLQFKSIKKQFLQVWVVGRSAIPNIAIFGIAHPKHIPKTHTCPSQRIDNKGIHHENGPNDFVRQIDERKWDFNRFGDDDAW